MPNNARAETSPLNSTQTTSVHAMNMAMESKGVATYNEAIQVCMDTKDSGSRELMERMVVESEESVDWAEAQLDLIKMVGLENYLAQQIGEPKQG